MVIFQYIVASKSEHCCHDLGIPDNRIGKDILNSMQYCLQRDHAKAEKGQEENRKMKEDQLKQIERCKN